MRGYETSPDVVWFNDPWDLRRSYMPYERFSKKWQIYDNMDQNNYGIAIRER